MAPKHHPTPLSGGDRKALQKELGKARAMTTILAAQSAEARAKGEALIRTADKLLAESWNERIWPMEVQSIHLLQSTKLLVVATPGSRSNARAAGPSGTWTWRRCAIRPPPSSTTSQAV